MPLFRKSEERLVSEYQKWDYITLSDFQLKSCGTVLSYAWIWCFAIIAVAVYAADTFTAVNLLVFDRWSSQIDPTIPFRISKWIFAACILFSWILCAYEWVRAIRVIRRRNVAESYLDPLAATLQSIRIDKKGRGWRRFLVFAELTKSKQGADYVALFVYFQFKGCFRLLLAEGPRQVVNGLTLYGVMQAKLFAVGQNAASDGHSSFVQFFVNIQILANQHTEQAVILFSMLFTFVIWAISALSFLVACALYGGFLWHYIPSTDRTLSRYCRRKIDKRLSRIVNVKFKAAIRKQDALRRRHQERVDEEDDYETFQKPIRRPTLPAVPDKSPIIQELDKELPMVIAEPMPPPYSYRPTRQERLAAQNPPLIANGNDFPKPSFPTRSGTLSSKPSLSSIDSDDNLLSQAATMGTSVTTRNWNEIGMQDLPVKDYDVYDSECTEDEMYGAERDRGRPFPTLRKSSQQPRYYNNNSPVRPLRSDSAPGTYPVPARPEGPVIKPPGRAMTTGTGRSGTSNNVRFGATIQIPPARNFSLPHRAQAYPSPIVPSRFTERSATDIEDPKVQEYEVRAPQYPVPAHNNQTPYNASPYNSEQQPSRNATPTYQVRVVQTPSQPRRNMTMPAEEPERFAPPRRVGTDPMPMRSSENVTRANDYGREHGYGDRGTIPDMRGMEAQAPRRDGIDPRYTTKKVYRFS